MDPVNIFTVDVEDYYHVSAFEQVVDRADWGRYESRVVANTQRLLDLLGRHRVKATFFVLGWVAEQHPDLVEKIHGLGHEIASHGYWHRLVYRQTPQQFRDDVCRSRDLLQRIIGRPVVAYRAPSFSITQESIWALDILAEEGFRVDSSIFPTSLNDRYGIPGTEPRPHRLATNHGDLWEFPPSIARVGRWEVPVGGGGYFRLYPARLTFHWLSRINRAEDRPFMFYIHPWEVDPRQPRVPVKSRRSRFRHYVNLSKTERRLDALLRRFRFGRLCDAAQVDEFGPAPHGPTARRVSAEPQVRA